MVMGRGEDGEVCADAERRREKAVRTRAREPGFMRTTPKQRMNAKKSECSNKGRSLAQARRRGRRLKRVCTELTREPRGTCAKGQFWAAKKYSAGRIFLLHEGTNLVFCECDLTSPSRASENRLGGRE